MTPAAVVPSGRAWSDCRRFQLHKLFRHETGRAPPSTPIRIGLLEHCGTGNLGDDATVAAVNREITIRWPHASIIGLSLDPVDSERRHGIPCYAIRRSVYPFERAWTSQRRELLTRPLTLKDRLKSILNSRSLFWLIKTTYLLVFRWPANFIRELVFLAQSFLVAINLDILIICGGGQLLDWGGPWAFPYTIFKWTMLAKLGGAKCLFLNNGAGPLDHRLSRWLVKRALLSSDYVSFRDQLSQCFINNIGVKNAGRVVADCAWALNVCSGGESTLSIENRNWLTIGIAPMAYCDPTRHWISDEAAYHRLIRTLARFATRLIIDGYQLTLFSSDIWFDSSAIDDLYSAINSDGAPSIARRVTRKPIENIRDFMDQMASVDCYVTCRFHGVVFAHLMNVPVLALAPHSKVTTLMNESGFSQYCLDIAQCDVDSLTTTFARLMSNKDDVKARIRCHATAYRTKLATQFDELFPTDLNHGDCLPIDVQQVRRVRK